jgi:hypothetical protein
VTFTNLAAISGALAALMLVIAIGEFKDYRCYWGGRIGTVALMVCCALACYVSACVIGFAPLRWYSFVAAWLVVLLSVTRAVLLMFEAARGMAQGSAAWWAVVMLGMFTATALRAVFLFTQK